MGLILMATGHFILAMLRNSWGIAIFVVYMFICLDQKAACRDDGRHFFV